MQERLTEIRVNNNRLPWSEGGYCAFMEKTKSETIRNTKTFSMYFHISGTPFLQGSVNRPLGHHEMGSPKRGFCVLGRGGAREQSEGLIFAKNKPERSGLCSDGCLRDSPQGDYIIICKIMQALAVTRQVLFYTRKMQLMACDREKQYNKKGPRNARRAFWGENAALSKSLIWRTTPMQNFPKKTRRGATTFDWEKATVAATEWTTLAAQQTMEGTKFAATKRGDTT